jgi:putative endonuclease
VGNRAGSTPALGTKPVNYDLQAFLLIMATIYILHSKQLDRFYTGSCKDLSYRIGQHFNIEFLKSFTAKADDWTLFFFKDGLEYKQARLIELHIKKMKSKTYIQNLCRYPEIIERLIEKYT